MAANAERMVQGDAWLVEWQNNGHPVGHQYAYDTSVSGRSNTTSKMTWNDTFGPDA
jgi:hypothetical protein